MNDILLRLVKKTKKKFIHEALEACDICMVSFDLWLFRGVDIFVLIIHLLDHNWESGHVIINLFETIKACGTSIGSQIEGERVFNIVCICTNMQWSIWGIQNLEMLVSIYKIG